MRGYINRPRVAMVEPFWLSRRNDFQQGAFLVPFNVRLSFEENIFFYLGMSEKETDERNVPEEREELINIGSVINCW